MCVCVCDSRRRRASTTCYNVSNFKKKVENAYFYWVKKKTF